MGKITVEEMKRLYNEEHAARVKVEKERDAARARIEDLGEMAGVCVGRYLGRRCSYCQCDGRNLSDPQTDVGRR